MDWGWEDNCQVMEKPNRVFIKILILLLRKNKQMNHDLKRSSYNATG